MTLPANADGIGAGRSRLGSRLGHRRRRLEEVLGHKSALDLAGRRLGQAGRDVELLRDLEVSQEPLRGGEDLGLGHRGALLQHHCRHDLLAVLLVRRAEGDRLRDGRVRQERRVDLQGGDLLAAAVDELLGG